jgi:RNA polymerase sigma factor for flagellar operon FliA
MAIASMMYGESRAQRSDELIRQHAPLVKRIAYHLLARLPSSVQLDDLIQAGMIGLLEASGKYDSSKGASFETYAGIRIRGAMMDEIRRGDWVPRSVHRDSRRIAEAIHAVESRTGRDASDQEVARELDVPLDQYHAILRDAMGGKLFSIDELGDSLESAGEESLAGGSPAEGVERTRFLGQLGSLIDRLPEREKLVLSLYYDEELNLKEIGEILSVSESRVSQLHSQALLRLRSRLSDWKN